MDQHISKETAEKLYNINFSDMSTVNTVIEKPKQTPELVKKELEKVSENQLEKIIEVSRR